MSVGHSLDQTTFDEHTGSPDRPVLVDFWAEWCHPCKAFDSILTSLAERDQRFTLASVDIDANPELTLRFDVMSAPTLVLLRDHQVIWRAVGARSLTRLSDELEPHLTVR